MAGLPKLLHLSRGQVEACGLGLAEMIEVLEKSFAAKGRGRVELPPKPGIHPRPDSFIHAMPCYIAGIESAGIKWVSGYPANPAQGLPYISGLLILNDAGTGLPLSVMDCSWITAWRTAAVSALSAKYLAKPGVKKLAICGAGVQGRTNLAALAFVLPDLEEVRVYDISDKALAAYLEEMRPKLPRLRILGVGSPREAVDKAEVILTAGPILKHPRPVIEDDWLAPGSLGLPLDFDSYFCPSAFLKADKFLTDDTPQIKYYQTVGYFPSLPPIHGDLGELVSGQVKGREREGERIICCNLGIALDDMATASLIYQKAKEKGLGTWLEL